MNREREIEDDENSQDEDNNNEYVTIGEVCSRDDPVSSEDSDRAIICYCENANFKFWF